MSACCLYTVRQPPPPRPGPPAATRQHNSPPCRGRYPVQDADGLKAAEATLSMSQACHGNNVLSRGVHKAACRRCDVGKLCCCHAIVELLPAAQALKPLPDQAAAWRGRPAGLLVPLALPGSHLFALPCRRPHSAVPSPQVSLPAPRKPAVPDLRAGSEVAARSSTPTCIVL